MGKAAFIVHALAAAEIFVDYVSSFFIERLERLL